MTGNWRILIALTVILWSGYSVILKLVSSKIQWQLSMLLFTGGYAMVVAAYCMFNSKGQLFMSIKSIAWWALICGCMCGLGSITFFKAIPQIRGSILYPLLGLYVPVSAVCCVLFLKEPIGIRGIAGIICASVAIVLLGR